MRRFLAVRYDWNNGTTWWLLRDMHRHRREVRRYSDKYEAGLASGRLNTMGRKFREACQ